MNKPSATHRLSLLCCFLFLLTTTLVGLSAQKWKDCNLLVWDISGYHIYLPATIIHHDITEYKFYEQIDKTYRPTGDVNYYALAIHPITGNRVNKYSLGVSYFEFPLFILAHWYASISNNYAIDGYSVPYQLGLLFSTILFTFLGLLILRRFLIHLGFKDWSIAITLLILSLGTNLFSYTAYQPGMAHPFSFFLYCCVLLLTLQLYKHFSFKTFAFLGFSLGLAILIRPVDIFLVLVPILWPLKTFRTSYQILFTKYKLYILAALAFAIIPWVPQFLYWKYTAGDFIYYSYTNEGFDFSNPEIYKGLFSYQKGWFVYTPLAFIGFVALLSLLWNKEFKNYAITTLLFYLISFWVIFSWHQWYYGGSFGSRVMINSLPLLGIPYCVLIDKILERKMIIKWISVLVCCSLIYLNIFQSFQYNKVIIHWDSMNKNYYWRIFLKNEASDEDRNLL